MKILSYNIMSGGFDDYGDMADKPERLDLLRKIIIENKADFVSLIDTYRWTEIFSRENLQKMFGYKNIFMIRLDDERLIKKGHDNGITVMTNLEVDSFKMIRLFNRNAVKTELKMSGKDVDVFSIYLDDMSEDTRLKQIEGLFGMIIGKPTIIMGDLNTLNIDDKTKLPIFGADLDKVLKDMNRGEVINFIERNGFFDTNLERAKTMPTKLFSIKLDNPILRLDYIFVNQYLESSNFEVLKGKIYNECSDHFPLATKVECR